MRAEGPVDWVVQALAIDRSDYIVIALPDGMDDAEMRRVVKRVRKAWKGAQVLFISGGVEVTSIEHPLPLNPTDRRQLNWLWKNRGRLVS